MTSEIRANTIKNRVGLGTVSYTNTGIVVSGIVTANSFSGPISGTTGTFSGDITISDKIIHAGDTNTAIRFPSDDTFSVETAGTERLRITSGGQIGIQKTPKEWNTDYRSLQIHDAGYIAGSTDDSFVAIGANNYLATDGNYKYTNTDHTSQLYQVDGTLVFRNAGAAGNDSVITWLERLRINSDGDVIIGGSSNAGYANYADNLTIHGTGNEGITIRSGTTSQGAIYFSDATGTGTGTYEGSVIYDHNDNYMSLATNHVQRLRIDSSGRLILGGTSAGPYHQDGDEFNIYSTGNTGMSIFSGNSSLGSLFFADDNNDVHGQRRGAIQYNHNGNYLAFWTNAGEKLRIDSDGRLLLGAGSIALPKGSGAGSFDLDNGNITMCIGGNSNSTGRTNSTDKINRVTSPHYTNSEEPVMMLSSYNISGNNTLSYGGGSGQTNATTQHIFYTAANTTTTTGTERMRIRSSGQVSISSDGTTDGLLTIKGNSDQVGTPSIRLLDGSDTREVSISNTAGDFVVSVHGNDNAIHGHIKMFESGIIDFNNGGASGSNVNRLRIDTGGRLYTGNSIQTLDSTAGALHVSGGTSGGRIAIRGTTTSADAGLAEIFAFWDTNKVAGMIAKSGGDTTNKDDGKLLFYTADGSGVVERLRISNSGNVLINNLGNATPGVSTNADDLIIGYGTQSGETGMTMFSTSNSGIRFNDNSGTDAAIEYSHSARELRFNAAGANRLQFGINASNSPVFTLGTGHYSGDGNNHNKGDRASVKVGAYLHLESATGAGHNSRAGLGYNCYFHSLEDFYCGSRSPSSGDNRPAAYGMAYGNHYFYSDTSNTAHSAQAQLTMPKIMEINRNGRIKFGSSLPHQLHTQGFTMYPNNGGNNITRLTFTGLQFGTYIAQIGYYNAAGQGYGGACMHVSGYQTASYTYNVHEIVRWDNASNSSISAIMKYNSSWVIDITNTHSSYTGAGEVSVYGDAQVTCTVTYHS